MQMRDPETWLHERPRCPKCQMRMITVTGPMETKVLNCLRCGHVEIPGTDLVAQLETK
jgi:hypothetical protein